MLKYNHYLTFLNVLYYENLNSFTYDCSNGKINHSFIFVFEGNACFITNNGIINVKSGEMIYIPKYQKYKSVYNGNISYCNIVCGFSPDFLQYGDSVKIPPIQKILFSDICSEDEVKDLHNAFVNPNISGNSVMIKFYNLYEKISASLKYEVTKKSYNSLEPALDYMQQHIDENYKIKQLAELCFMSERSFYKNFKCNTGYSPIEYKNRLKVQRAMIMLSDGETSIKHISAALGFNSDEYFTKIFKSVTGFTPTTFHKNQTLSEKSL